MSWQSQVFDRLRTREWQEVGPLFEAFEAQIPLHYAMRHAMMRGRTELPTNIEARWRLFTHVLSAIGVENMSGKWVHKWSDKIRLRYLPEQVCRDCSGPVVKASWKSYTKSVCLDCQPVLQPEPVVVPKLPEPVIATPEPVMMPWPEPVVAISEPVVPEPVVATPQSVRVVHLKVKNITVTIRDGVIEDIVMDPPPPPPVVNLARKERYTFRRAAIAALRGFLPAWSATKLERLLQACGDNVSVLLTKFGIPYQIQGRQLQITRKPTYSQILDLTRKVR